MEILITGGLGYIGSVCCLKLIGKYRIIIVDNLSNSNTENLEYLKILDRNLEFYNIDIRDNLELTKIFESHNIQLVIHLASLKSVSESMINPLKYYNNNINGTINLLEIMEKYGCKKIIFSSSACVYESSDISHKENEKIDINKIPNSYGKTKYMIEQIIQDTCNLNGFQSIILRYFNPIGYFSNLKNTSTQNKSNLFEVIIGSIQSDTCFSIFGNDYLTKDGFCIRDFIHIEDLVDGHMECIQILKNIEEGNFFEIINLGTGTGCSVKEFIDEFEKKYNLKLKYNIAPRRSGDVSISLANIDKAKKLLNWKPRNLKDIVNDLNYLSEYNLPSP
jgi:UDP-glucose 4-epimerase